MSKDILIVDDEADIRDLVGEILSEEGFSIRSADKSDTALYALADRVPNLVLLDIWLQGSELDGLGILEIIQSRYPNLPVIMISGHGTIETAVNAIKMGAYDFIEKPFTAEKLLHIVKKTLELSRLKQENVELRMHSAREDQLIGNSTAINQIRQVIEKVAPTNSRIMIMGEEGSGKEIVARQIHRMSSRRNGNFVVFNASGVHPSQLDSELFGVEATGPAGGAEKLGLLEKAHGGTLFIDEVGDMSRETQGRFLKALHDQAFERVRGNKRVQVDVRVIAASNRNLKEEMKSGRFREDLYYRLSVVPIQMPSLRERREDIPDLCHYFLNQAAKQAGMAPRRLTDEALTILQSYTWPGNIRHLKNIMEWLLIMASGHPDKPIDETMLPPDLKESHSTITRPEDGSAVMSLPLREAREIFEKQYLMAQIARFGGNISKTASFIGMERSALHRKLKLLGIHNEEKIPA